MKQPSTSFFSAIEIYFRSALFLLGMVLSTLFIAPLTLLLIPFRFETRYRLAKCWVWFNLWTLRTICRLDFEVQGAENIPKQNGIILCKHQSAWETIALQAIFPPVSFILKRELLRIPVWGWAMATLEPIAIARQAKSTALKQVLKDGEKRLRQGRWVVIFPEGTRVPPGQRGRYGGSGGILAHKVGIPVVPVAHNAGEYWARRGFRKFPGTIRIHIGPPIDGAHDSAGEINQKAEQWIERQMVRITGLGPLAPRPRPEAPDLPARP